MNMRIHYAPSDPIVVTIGCDIAWKHNTTGKTIYILISVHWSERHNVTWSQLIASLISR